MNLYDYLFENAVEGATALLYNDSTSAQIATYGDLMALSNSVAATLQSVGVQMGDRVALLAENSPFWVASYLGCIKIGAVAAPIPMRLTLAKMIETIEALDCTAFCLDTPRLVKYLPLLPAHSRIVTTNRLSALASETHHYILEPIPNGYAPTVDVDERETLAALMFTSGSTGQPNAVKVSHLNIRANTASIIDYLDLNAEDRIMDILPFEYCFGTSLLHTHLRAGGSLVLQNTFMFLEDVLKRLQNTQCSGFAGVPATYQHLLRRSSLSSRAFPNLRKVQQAGGRLPTPFITEFLKAQPQAKLYIMYGQTEATARLSYLSPERLHDKLGSIGRGIAGVTLRVLNAVGQPVAVGEVGEVVAEGDNITGGYWVPDPNKNPFRDDRLYTGDLAHVDEEGFIFLTDRISDFIKPMGHRVSSREIEEVLAGLPDVIEAAVVGMPDDVVGEAVCAFVVLLKNSTLAEKEILDYCKRSLTAYAVPRRIVVVEELPKSEAGKVLKRELKGSLQ